MSSYITDGYGASGSEENELDLARLLGEAIDHRVMILVFTLLFTLAAGVYVIFATPVYRADALIQVESKKDNSPWQTLEKLAPDLTPDAEPEMLLLKSRMILGKTVDDLRLNYRVHQRSLPVVGPVWAKIAGKKPASLTLGMLQLPGSQDELLLTVLDRTHFRVEGAGIHAQGETGKPLYQAGVTLEVKNITAAPGDQFSLSKQTRLEAINTLNTALTVTELAKQSGMLSLTLTGTHPEKLEKTLNHIAENYLQQNIRRQAEQDARSLAFLQRQLPQVQRELDTAEERLNDYRKQRDSVDLSLEAKSVLEQMVNVENQLNELTFREAEVSQHFKKDHPTFRALLEKRQTLEAEKEKLNKRITTMPTTQQHILRLSRDVDSGRVIYQQLLTRQQELNISRSSTIGNVRIIDAAVTQPEAIKPKKMLIMVLGVLTGLIFSIGIVMVRLALRRGIDGSDALEAQGFEVMATLPRSPWLWKQTRLHGINLWYGRNRHIIKNVPFLPVDKPLDLFVEAVRGLRASLYFTLMEAENRIIMISGPTQDCGKTLVSTSLASVVAQAGKQVLFIDADMRKGYVHHIFSLPNTHGLAQVLAGSRHCEEVVQRYEAGEIDVITCGEVQGNPSELLMREAFQQLMEWANARYDMVIVDTPPILAVSDSLLVGRAAASTLLVARFGMNTAKEMQVCLKRLQQVGVTVKGAILNDIVHSSASYYRTGYRHAYDYGYADEKQGKNA
ncbi:polysaccharide biosynthesis tyrosine autokinase [Pseudenterobacter timonensis]|uniref:Polysaccharide biosynthesis tyrosine autokinase n=1 Tax=Pseudenterobacter timonensis TaxID=1755099 RepID=A0AAE4DJB2_9ENTR|nr:polysaccharide biosynthesis tyrosine autokinase [Pseudenterobacter timonensis]MDR9888815.1 polysaccharide biosynthesis tyrosine autokinase [Pseudenterobacter timonensis]